jgi:hypothetical protein
MDVRWRELGKVEGLLVQIVRGWRRDIQGWVVLRRVTIPQSLIRCSSGGRFRTRPAILPEVQLYAAAELWCYPGTRGSTSYGEEFGNLLYHSYPWR